MELWCYIRKETSIPYWVHADMKTVMTPKDLMHCREVRIFDQAMREYLHIHKGLWVRPPPSSFCPSPSPAMHPGPPPSTQLNTYVCKHSQNRNVQIKLETWTLNHNHSLLHFKATMVEQIESDSPSYDEDGCYESETKGLTVVIDMDWEKKCMDNWRSMLWPGKMVAKFGRQSLLRTSKKFLYIRVCDSGSYSLGLLPYFRVWQAAACGRRTVLCDCDGYDA